MASDYKGTWRRRGHQAARQNERGLKDSGMKIVQSRVYEKEKEKEKEEKRTGPKRS